MNKYDIHLGLKKDPILTQSYISIEILKNLDFGQEKYSGTIYINDIENIHIKTITDLDNFFAFVRNCFTNYNDNSVNIYECKLDKNMLIIELQTKYLYFFKKTMYKFKIRKI